MPLPRDDHTAVVHDGREMIVFGGFVDGGERTNETYIYIIKDNKWEILEAGKGGPKPRAGHSAVVYGNMMVVFGGRDEDNEKLNDLWIFDIPSRKWKEEKPVSPAPIPRSGHSACIVRDQMMIFGGILEVTKELDDMHTFDFKSKRWVSLFEETHSPSKTTQLPTTSHLSLEASP